MTTPHDPIDDLPVEAEVIEAPERAKPVRKDPAATLNTALLVYVVVTALFAVPLLVFPAGFYDLIGVNELVARNLHGLRWVGAMLAAWTVSGVLVIAKPAGRAFFVTTGALQLTAGAAAFVYTWLAGDTMGYAGVHATFTIVLIVASVYLWWARLRGRKVLSGVPKE